MDFFKKTTLIIFSIWVLIQAFAQTAQPSPKCAPFLPEIIDCKNFMWHNLDESDAAAKCGDDVKKKSVECDDNTALKIIDHQAKAYELTKQFFRKGSFNPGGVVMNTDCLNAVDFLLYSWLAFVPDFLTDKGCVYYKTMILSSLQLDSAEKCSLIIEDYKDKLFSTTTCANVSIDVPETNDARDFTNVMNIYRSCLNFLFIQCGSGKNERHLCVERATTNKINITNLKRLEKGIVDIVSKTDEFFCENLPQDGTHDICFKSAAYYLIKYLVDDIPNEYRTEEGCDGLKYFDYILVGTIVVNCRSLVGKFLNEKRSCFTECQDCNSLGVGVKYCATSVLLIIPIFALTYNL